MEKGFFYWIWRLLTEYGSYFLNGALVTVVITILGTLTGYIIGFLVGIVQFTPIEKEDTRRKKIGLRTLKVVCRVYVEIFRGTPMIVQAMVIYYGSINFLNLNISSFLASILVVMLNTGSYMAETVRGGIQAIDPGQMEGAQAMGMSHMTAMINVILPQAFRNVLPEMGNTFITNLKMTSVLNVIAVTELYFVTKTAAGTYYKFFEAYVLVGIIYFILTFIFTKIVRLIEKLVAGKDSYELVEVEEPKTVNELTRASI